MPLLSGLAMKAECFLLLDQREDAQEGEVQGDCTSRRIEVFSNRIQVEESESTIDGINQKNHVSIKVSKVQQLWIDHPLLHGNIF